MNDSYSNRAIRAYEIMKEQGWKEGDIASLAAYIDDRFNRKIRFVKWAAGGLAVLILVAPELTRRLADRFIFG